MIHGAGRLGRQVLHLLRTHFATTHEVLGFVDDIRAPDTPVTEGLQVLGSLADVARDPATAPARVGLIPAIGYTDQSARGRALARAQRLGYTLPTLVHPHAWIEPGSSLGQGVIAMAGVLVDQAVRIGDFCYLDQGVKVGEECTLAANTYLAAGAILAGGVQVGRDGFIGCGAVVTDGVCVGDRCVINAQSLVHRDLPADHKLIQTRDEVRLPLPTADPIEEAEHGQA